MARNRTNQKGCYSVIPVDSGGLRKREIKERERFFATL